MDDHAEGAMVDGYDGDDRECVSGGGGERQGVVELPIADRLSSIGEVREVGVGSVGALSLVAPTFLL